MIEPALTALQHIQRLTEQLLREGDDNDWQRTTLLHIDSECRALRDLLLSLVNFRAERARALLSYDGRTHLTNIIGYVEDMLEDESPEQRAQQPVMQELLARCQDLLNTLPRLAE